MFKKSVLPIFLLFSISMSAMELEKSCAFVNLPVFAPTRLGEVKLLHDGKDFFVYKEDMIKRIQPGRIDKVLRRVCPESLLALEDKLCLSLNESEEGEYSLDGYIKANGGGEPLAKVVEWITFLGMYTIPVYLVTKFAQENVENIIENNTQQTNEAINNTIREGARNTVREFQSNNLNTLRVIRRGAQQIPFNPNDRLNYVGNKAAERLCDSIGENNLRPGVESGVVAVSLLKNPVKWWNAYKTFATGVSKVAGDFARKIKIPHPWFWWL